MKTCYVYLLASQRNGTLYCGVTNDLVRRVWEHRNTDASKFTSKYDVTRLVWFEEHSYAPDAIRRETAIKGWRREWKIALIEKTNPHWADLYESLLPHPLPSTILHKLVIPGGGAQRRRPGTQEPPALLRPQAPAATPANAAPGFRVSASLRPE